MARRPPWGEESARRVAPGLWSFWGWRCRRKGHYSVRRTLPPASADHARPAEPCDRAACIGRQRPFIDHRPPCICERPSFIVERSLCIGERSAFTGARAPLTVQRRLFVRRSEGTTAPLRLGVHTLIQNDLYRRRSPSSSPREASPMTATAISRERLGEQDKTCGKPPSISIWSKSVWIGTRVPLKHGSPCIRPGFTASKGARGLSPGMSSRYSLCPFPFQSTCGRGVGTIGGRPTVPRIN